MFLLLGLAGLVMLVTIIWLFRNLGRSSTTLNQRRERWFQGFAETELATRKEQKEISTQDQLHFLEAAVQDLLRLEDLDVPSTCSEQGIKIELSDQTCICSYFDHAEHLTSLRKTLHGPGHWILKTDTEVFDFTTIDQLMSALTNVLRGLPATEELPYAAKFRPRGGRSQYRGPSGGVN